MERFALGAAIGRSTARKNACAVGEDGTRRESVGRPHETNGLTFPFDGYTIVSGPGRKHSRRRAVHAGVSTSRAISYDVCTCAMSGLSAGRPLSAKTFLPQHRSQRPRRARTPSRYGRRRPPRIDQFLRPGKRLFRDGQNVRGHSGIPVSS